jgi:hypothetical protein
MPYTRCCILTSHPDRISNVAPNSVSNSADTLSYPVANQISDNGPDKKLSKRPRVYVESTGARLPGKFAVQGQSWRIVLPIMRCEGEVGEL